MQTSIDRSHRRPQKRRRIDSHPNTADFVRRTAWLSWPLIHWSGRAATDVPAEGALVRTLHGMICGQLRSSPPGLYALQPAKADRDDARLLAVTSQRLATAAHTLALAEKGEPREVQETAATRQQLNRQVRVLGQALRELLAGDLPPSGQRILRQVAWKLDRGEVQPPLEIDRLLNRHPELTYAGMGQAIMEFALRSSTPDIARFLQSLCALFAECEMVDAEPERRMGIFCSILKQAMTFEAPYLPLVFVSPSRGTITKWKPNPAFAKTAVALFFRDYRPAATREFSAEAKEAFTFECMCTWIVGSEVPPFRRGPLMESPEPPDAVAPMIEVLEKLPRAKTQRIQFANLAARCAALSRDVDAPRRLVSWLRACRLLWHAKEDSGSIWDWAVRSLEHWIVASGLGADHGRQLTALLEARSLELLVYGWVRHATPPAALWSLAKLGRLRHEDALAIVDLDLIGIAHEHFTGKPEHLAAFLKLVARHRRHWIELKEWTARSWTLLFGEAHEPQFLHRLLHWIDHLFTDRAFTFHDVTSFMGDLEDFLSTSEAAPERAPREIFVSGHTALLDRILDEVEITLQALPESGFEEWRSHGALWSRRFGILEIFHQWKTAGFPDAAGLLEELFAWCRKDDRIALARQESRPPDHFRNSDGNEALIVRLSGGSSRQLIGLLEYYVDCSRNPDDPLDGWRFLDRYPPIQQALQQLCQRPGRIRPTIRVLQRLALGLRLQCRTFLQAHLEQWMAAAAQPEPLGMLRAFSALAGAADPLPSAVERIQAREQQLQRERDTLSKMHTEGSISASAMKRFGKLERLLVQPSAIAAWVEKDTRRLVAKLLPLVKATALSVITRDAVRHHWKELVDRDSTAWEGRDWDNALHFYYSVDKNKEVLRKLLRHAAQSDCPWRRQHPPNVQFLAGLRANGFDAETWLAPYRTAMEVHGETWTVHLEQDPLRVLQMGNLFGTCLSVDAFNAFAAIANAVEINKQVLYLRDGRGVTLGRKLIGLTAEGRLIGFRSYGASCLSHLNSPEKAQVWIKILFDLACLQLVRRVNGQFDRSPELEKSADQLRLAAHWYNDGPEEFDWWITRPDLAERICRMDKEPVAFAILQHIHQHGLDIAAPKHRALETLRAMLWLGDEAAMIIESLGPNFFSPKCARYLRCQSPSATVQALLA